MTKSESIMKVRVGLFLTAEKSLDCLETTQIKGTQWHCENLVDSYFNI